MKAAMFKDQIKVKNEMEIYLKNRFFVVLPSLFSFFFFYLDPIKKKKKNQDENRTGLYMLRVIKAPIK